MSARICMKMINERKQLFLSRRNDDGGPIQAANPLQPNGSERFRHDLESESSSQAAP